MRSSRSNTVTVWPARFNKSAAAKPAGPDPTIATFFPVRRAGGDATIQPSSESPIHDRDFDLLDRDRIRVDSQNTGALAGRRTQAAGELGKVVRRMQALNGFPPVIPIDQIIPIGNDVAERATLMAKRNATVHAALCLLSKLLFWKISIDFLPVPKPLGNRPAVRSDTADLEKTARISHAAPALSDHLDRPFVRPARDDSPVA